MLRKILVLTFGLSTSLGVVAYQTPCRSSGLELQVEGLYLRPNDDGLKFAALVSNQNTNGPPSQLIDIRQVDANYRPAFKLGIGYLFPCTYSDLWLQWTHLNMNASDSLTSEDKDQSVELPFFLDNNDPFQSGKGHVKFKYDAVDFNLGQYVNFCRLTSRIWFGLRYARINRDFDYSIFQTELQRDATSLESINIFNNTKFRGTGPQFGVDSTYALCNGLGIVGGFSVAGLIGKVNTHTRVFVQTTNQESFTIALNFPDNTRLVPSIDGKLGLQYQHHFCNDSIVKVCAGYQYSYYIDAINDIAVLPGNKGLTSADTKAIEASFQGPFLSLQLKL